MHVEGIDAYTNLMGAPVVDHELSVRSNAAERYLLGELSAEESEEFVEHFFECEVCAQEVRLGFHLKENAKAVFETESRMAASRAAAPKRRPWWGWLQPSILVPATACLLLACVTGYQNLAEIPALRATVGRLEAPQVIQQAMVLPPSSRAEAPTITIGAGDPFIQLSLAVEVPAPAERYELDFMTGSGEILFKVPVEKLDTDSNLNLRVPSSKLVPGVYQAVLSGMSGGKLNELDRYRFSIQYR